MVFLLLGSFSQAQSFRWGKKAGSTQDDWAWDVVTDNSNNIYVVGMFKGTINFDSAGFTKPRVSAGGEDIYIAKLNCSRDLMWANRIGGTSDETGDFNGTTVVYDKIGHIYVSGAFQGTCTFTSTSGSSQVISSAGGNDAFLAKYDTLGVLLWVVQSGGGGSDEVLSMNVDNAGDIVLGGLYGGAITIGTTSGSTVSLPHTGAADGFLAKYSPAGILSWATRIYSPGDDIIGPPSFDANNNIYVAGNFGCCGANTTTFGSLSIFNNGGGWGAYVAKASPGGTWLWVNGTGSSSNEGGSSCLVDSGYVYFTGHFAGTTAAMSSSSGSPIAMPSIGGYDIFLAKFDLSGVLQWVNVDGSAGNDYSWGFILNKRNNISVYGGFSNTANFSGPTLTSAGGLDIYIAEYNKNGVGVSALRAGGSGDDQVFGMTCDDNGALYICGGFSNTTTFGPSTLNASGGTDSYIAKISPGQSFLLKNPGAICSPDSAIITAQSPLPANSTFSWLRNGSAMAGETNDSLYAKTTGNYQLIVTNHCNEKDSSQAVALSVLSVTATAGNDTTIVTGDSAQLHASGGTIYSWSPVTGLSNANIANPKASPAVTTQYIVTVSNGTCLAKDTIVVTVNTSVQSCNNCGSADPLNANLVACYPFNGNANDESGNGNHGTMNGTSLTTDRNGEANKAMLFGGGSYISTPNSATLQSPSTAITLSAWIYITSWFPYGGTNYASVLCKSTTPSSTQYRFTITQTSMDLIFSGTQTIASVPSNFMLNTWYHVAVTSSGGVAKFYINGATFASTPAVGSFPANTIDALEIGRDIAGTTDYFNGKIDDIRIYNRALSASEIMQVFNLSQDVTASAGSDITICSGDIIQLSASGGSKYKWTPAATLDNDSINNPYAKPTSTTDYIVTVTSGACSAKDTVKVTVDGPVSAHAGTSQTLCLGDSVQLTATGGGKYKWTPSATVSNDTLSNPYVKPTTTTDYIVTVTVGICSARDTVEVTVVTSSTLSAGTDKTICQGDSVQLVVTGGGNYIWRPSIGMDDSTSATPKVSPPVTTKYQVVSTVGTCVATDTVLVTVNTLPSVSAGIDVTLCPDVPYPVPAISSGANQYQWTPTTFLNNATVLQPVITANTSTQYIVKASNSTTGCSNYDTLQITISSPQASFTASPLTGTIPFDVHFTNTSIATNPTYTWYFEDVDSFYYDEDIQHTYKTRGVFRVGLVVTDENGCIDTASLSIEAFDELKVFIPNVFTPNGDSINDYFVIAYTQGALDKMTGTIWNRWGAKVYEFTMPDGVWWDGTEGGQLCSDGVYFYIVQTKDHRGQIKKYHGTVTLLR